MPTQKTMFNLENGAKLVALLIVGYNITTGIDDIKKDIALIKQGAIYEVDKLDYRITKLEENNNRSDKKICFNQQMAIVPNSIELETEK